MNKTIIKVPAGINYISEWNDFKLPSHPCILNKQLTGCGFTQWCLTNSQNIILCSPRRILLENKEDQYLEELKSSDLPYRILYARNNYEKQIEYDQDTNKDDLKSVSKGYLEEEANREIKSKNFTVQYKNIIKNFYNKCCNNPFEGNKYCKILVTYDSYRKVKEALEEIGVFDQFHVVIDEMQSVFTDSTFKANTEMEFVDHLQGISRICYVSATPMIEEYMDMLNEFKDLPYYELDWKTLEPTRVSRPGIRSYPISNLMRKAYEIVMKYKDGTWKDSDGNTKHFIGEDGLINDITSREVVIFMNSVKNICDIIKHCKLSPEQCNVLCANTKDNLAKIKKAFKLKPSDQYEIGKVPKKSEMDKNKTFTFCTRTVYLGADFYSTNARTFVFSDANSKCLTVDISLDLPQIMGRQRYEGNPWKNEVIFYYYSTRKDKIQSEEDFIKDIKAKEKESAHLLSAYNSIKEEDRLSVVKKYEESAMVKKYEWDYISVNRHSGNSPVPVFNNLVLVSELRSYYVGRIDYADQFSVRNSLQRQFGIVESSRLSEILEQFNNEYKFVGKMRYLCELKESEEIINEVLNSIGDYYSNYYRILGPTRILELSCRRDWLENELKVRATNQSIDPTEEIYSEFIVGNKYSKVFIKNKLGSIYSNLGYKKTPKATDLENYFETRSVNYMEGGKKIHGFELLGKREK